MSLAGKPPQDWVAWHKMYEHWTPLQQRLSLVKTELYNSLAKRNEQHTVVTSICAGAGLDIDVLLENSKDQTIVINLLEKERDLLTQAKLRLSHKLRPNIELHYLERDATQLSSYASLPRAHTLIICGVFGNLTSHEIENLLSCLPMLCHPGASLIWTKGTRVSEGGEESAEHIIQQLASHNFRTAPLNFSEGKEFAVGHSQFNGNALPFDPSRHFFRFDGFWVVNT